MGAAMDHIIDHLAAQPPQLLWGLGGVVVLLTLAAVVAHLLPVLRPWRERITRVRT